MSIRLILQHIDITLQHVPNIESALRLFVENEKRMLETKDHETWTPVQCLYVPSFATMHTHRSLFACRGVSPTAEMHVEIELKRGHVSWAKKEQISKSIDIQKLFNNYWTSAAHELIVPGQSRSPTGPLVSDRETQKSLSLESMVAF